MGYETAKTYRTMAAVRLRIAERRLQRAIRAQRGLTREQVVGMDWVYAEIRIRGCEQRVARLRAEMERAA